jgi:hypothetical protein
LKGKQISLGLSGGLDSRVLLSLILRSGRKDFQTHTFGNLLDPDVSVPKTIAEKERFVNITYDTLITTTQELTTILLSYAAETNLIEPISTALRLKNVFSLDPNRFILIDGGFGEIARRQYMNRLALYGERPFRDHNIELILNNLRVRRGNFFSVDIVRQMEEGVHEEISEMMQTMPDIREIGLGNYLDLWSVRARFPNFGSDEQARLDKHILNYMPFAQLSFINSVFSMPISLRKNGTLFREIIKTSYTQLTKYPLVKSGVTYPFSFSTKASWLFTKIKSMTGKRFNENHIDPFLGIMREYIFDLLHSKGVQENPAYNYPHIRSSIENYYRGDMTNKSELIWWLTFELWRRSVELK